MATIVSSKMSSDTDVPNTDATDTQTDAPTDAPTDTPTDAPTDAPTQTSNTLTYIKDEVDYATYVEDFARDEFSFYNIIKSYTGARVILSFTIHNKVVSQSNLSENGMVTEFLRNDEHVHTTFNTIFDWVTNYNGPTELTYILDTVVIGEDVPLWYVLEDMKEADDEVAEDEAQDKAEEEEHIKIEEIRVNGIVNIVCVASVSLIFIYCLTVITAIDTHLMNPITYESMK